MRKILFPLLIFSLLFDAVLAQEKPDSVSKKSYSLFKPVPKDEMREMQTDRPDITESAYTVDAGHFQLETDLFKTSRLKDEFLKSTLNYYNLINLKMGITNTTDLQLVVESFVDFKALLVEDVENPGDYVFPYKENGFGDITLRLKQNLWGNNSGKSALAIMPFVKFPTSSLSGGKFIEGGVVVPLAVDLGNDWGFGAQAQIDFLKEGFPFGDKYHVALLNSYTVGHPISKKSDFFVETYGQYDFLNDDLATYFNGGIIYSFSKNLKADVGFNYSLNNNLQIYFLGLSFRY